MIFENWKRTVRISLVPYKQEQKEVFALGKKTIHETMLRILLSENSFLHDEQWPHVKWNLLLESQNRLHCYLMKKHH